jgi:hypothetical protein
MEINEECRRLPLIPDQIGHEDIDDVRVEHEFPHLS